MSERKVKVALVGCGQIADAHLQEIHKIPCADLVAVCDAYADLARQASARFGVPGVYGDLERMLEAVRPHVLHVTTPPHTHREIALRALAAGVHVYVEKPFAVDLAEAEEVLRSALAHGRLVCVGHDQLFDPIWEECRRLSRSGELGRVVHVDSVLGYDLSGPFGKAFAGEPSHWIHRLPGQLFHNTISHALYRITDFLTDERPQVWATWFGGGTSMGCPTELRVLLQGEAVTANLMFTSTARPLQRVARLYGTRQGIEVDLDARLVRRYRRPLLPGPLAKIEVPFRHFQEAGRSLARNLWKLVRSDLHYFASLNRLFTLFYQAILEGGEPPIPYAEIRRVTAIMDEIFRACRSSQGINATLGKRAEGNGLAVSQPFRVADTF